MRAATRPVTNPASPAAPSRASLTGIMACIMLGPFVNILDYNVVNLTFDTLSQNLR